MTTEKISSPVFPKIRFSAIDRFRGYSTFYMIIYHSFMFWLLPQEQYIVGIGWLFLEVMGANAFIFVAGMNMSLSYNNYWRKVDLNPQNAQQAKWNGRLQMWIRTGWIALLACVANAIGTLAFGGPQVWIWLVLQTMWVSRLICYPFLHLKAWIRFIVGIAIFMLADPLRIWSMTQAPLLYFILFNSSELNPLFPFVGFFFIGSAIGSILDGWTQAQTGVKSHAERRSRITAWAQKHFRPRNVAFLGLIFFGVALLLGGRVVTSDLTPYLVARINSNPALNYIDALPAFLEHGSTSWSFYAIGSELIIFAAFLISDFHKVTLLKRGELVVKDAEKEVPKGLSLFGQQSLTVYLSHYALFFLSISNLWIWQWFLIAPPIGFGYYACIWVWANGKGKGYTLDWVIGKTSDLLSKRILRHYFPVVAKPIACS